MQKTNPKTGEMELKEEKMLLNVGASGDDDQADEIDDSATSSDGFSKTSESRLAVALHPKIGSC